MPEVLAEKDEREAEPERKTKVDEDDEDDEDEGKSPGELSVAERLSAMRRLVEKKLGAKHELTTALVSAIEPLM